MIDNIDILELIASHLQIKDVYHLRNTCKLYHHIDMKKNIINQINKYLSNIFIYLVKNFCPLRTL